tara:strand:- start:190 stop:777 length:588 start_codon:yes stop_codon:yes gene_type:complete
MFTGIIEEVGKIRKLNRNNDIVDLEIDCKKIIHDLKTGESVSVSGICLTVTKIMENSFTVQIVPETINRTNAKYWVENTLVNLERSLQLSDRINGHIVQGHVDETFKVKEVNIIKDSWVLSFILNKKFQKFIIYKGSISINGVSLTISSVKKDFFSVSLIPETLKRTNLVNLKSNDLVNVEIDIFAKYIENFLKN